MQRLSLLAVTAVLAAGCASATAGGPDNGAAAYVPGDALLFVAATTKTADWLPSQWKQLAPAVGSELDVAVLKDDTSVAFTQPRDAAKLDALVQKHALVSKRVGDWTAVAKTQAALDAVGPTALSLAENDRFRAAMDRVPDDAFVHVYASGAKAQQLLTSVPGQLTTVSAPFGVRYRFGQPSTGTRPTAATLGMVDIRWAAAGITREKKGYRVEGVVKTGEVISPGPPRYLIIPTPVYTPSLLDEIPADVLAVVDFPVPIGAFELLDKLPPEIVRLFGSSFDLAFQLDTIMRGETALYVRAGAPQPELTLVTQPSDIGAAEQSLQDLLTAAPKPLALYHASIGGQFVVSTSRAGIAEFRGGGTKLSADPAFLEAKKLSGLGDEVGGLAYARVGSAFSLLRLAGVELPGDLPKLGSALGFGAQGTNERTFTTFVQSSSG